MKPVDYVGPTFNGDWTERHRRAVALPHGLERPLVHSIRVWIEYAERHYETYGTPIGHDLVLGPAWARWGVALRVLLNGDLGRLDAGALDTIIYENLQEQGYDADTGKGY